MDWPERTHVSKSKTSARQSKQNSASTRSWERPPRRSGSSSVYEVLDNLDVTG